MKPNNLKEIVRAGFTRYFFDGVSDWSKRGIEGLISPSGFTNSLDDLEIISMFKELEAEGILKIIGTDDIFLKILKSP